MKTTTMRTMGAIFSAGILMTSCVSSKKYHRSQDEVAKLRADSTKLAQQGASLQQNLTAEQQKTSDLQKSFESANTANAGLTKNVAYYHDYSEKQQSSTKQIKDDLSTTLAPAGLTDQDVMLTDGKIYINVSEKSLFKGNSAVLTPKGKQLVDNLGQFVKGHDGVDVSVADLQQATGTESGGTGNAMASSGTTGTDANMTNTGTGNSSSGNVSSNSASTGTTSKKSDWNSNSMSADKTAHKTAAVHHKKKVQPASGESKAVAYSSGHHNKYTAERSNRSLARAIAWKRQNAVADAMLKNGIPKVKVIAQNASQTTGGQKGVQVILVNNMDDFYKHMSQAPASGQPVSVNP